MENIENLVKTYHSLDSQIKELESEKKPLNLTLKDHMRQNGLKDLAVGGLKLSFSVQERASMNEAKLLRRLKELGLDEAVKMVEVPDQAVIERMLYDGTLTPQTLADCTETKVVETLSVKEVKTK